ncbi:MAG: hypothetical protein HYX79_09705 [Chloroflexi bacterium]|nr:hypothetical protein [Chloroflexota bacterium]
MDSIRKKRGLTFSVEISRQGGKNELSARLEHYLLTIKIGGKDTLVKCSPTFNPQTLISMRRLMDLLKESYSQRLSKESGHIVRLGDARAVFLSADESSNVVGNTASLLLEIDEAQDVSKEKFTRDFKPMGAAYNVTTALYGTTWDDFSLLEEVKQTNLELERKDGVKRHFRYDWQEVARYNPHYLAYVEGERQRLGECHPLFMTQYRLLPVHGGGGFLSVQQRSQLQGEHARMRHREQGKLYVAGIDIAGEAEEEANAFLQVAKPRQDSTVMTIGELDFSACDEIRKQPAIRIVEHYWWNGKKHTELYARMVDILRNVWHCRSIVVDATGMGQPVSSFLKGALGSKVSPFTFTEKSKSELGFNLLAAVNSGRLKMYAGDGSPEYQEFWEEIEKAKSQYRPSQTMNFYVDPSQGHDDFLMSLALVVETASGYSPREARGR